MAELLENPVITALINRVIGPVESNANGEWVRLENGLQLCWHELPVVSTPHAMGAIFRSDSITWTFPRIFAATPRVFAGVRWAVNDPFAARVAGGIAFGSVDFRLYGALSGSQGAIQALAIGRWK